MKAMVVGDAETRARRSPSTGNFMELAPEIQGRILHDSGAAGILVMRGVNQLSLKLCGTAATSLLDLAWQASWPACFTSVQRLLLVACTDAYGDVPLELDAVHGHLVSLDGQALHALGGPWVAQHRRLITALCLSRVTMKQPAELVSNSNWCHLLCPPARRSQSDDAILRPEASMSGAAEDIHVACVALCEKHVDVRVGRAAMIALLCGVNRPIEAPRLEEEPAATTRCFQLMLDAGAIEALLLAAQGWLATLSRRGLAAEAEANPPVSDETDAIGFLYRLVVPVLLSGPLSSHSDFATSDPLLVSCANRARSACVAEHALRTLHALCGRRSHQPAQDSILFVALLQSVAVITYDHSVGEGENPDKQLSAAYQEALEANRAAATDAGVVEWVCYMMEEHHMYLESPGLMLGLLEQLVGSDEEAGYRRRLHLIDSGAVEAAIKLMATSHTCLIQADEAADPESPYDYEADIDCLTSGCELLLGLYGSIRHDFAYHGADLRPLSRMKRLLTSHNCMLISVLVSTLKRRPSDGAPPRQGEEERRLASLRRLHEAALWLLANICRSHLPARWLHANAARLTWRTPSSQCTDFEAEVLRVAACDLSDGLFADVIGAARSLIAAQRAASNSTGVAEGYSLGCAVLTSLCEGVSPHAVARRQQAEEAGAHEFALEAFVQSSNEHGTSFDAGAPDFGIGDGELWLWEADDVAFDPDRSHWEALRSHAGYAKAALLRLCGLEPDASQRSVAGDAEGVTADEVELRLAIERKAELVGLVGFSLPI